MKVRIYHRVDSLLIICRLHLCAFFVPTVIILLNVYSSFYEPRGDDTSRRSQYDALCSCHVTLGLGTATHGACGHVTSARRWIGYGGPYCGPSYSAERSIGDEIEPSRPSSGSVEN